MFGIIISFKNYNLYKGILNSPWVGLKYYRMFFENPDSFNIIRNTILLGVYRLFWGFPAPIIFALVLNEVRNNTFKRVVQTISYLPHFISTVIIAGMVLQFTSPRNGFINVLLKNIGLQPINFMVLPQWFRTIYIGSGIWQDIGWSAIIYLAALTSINPELYEAATVDGANKWDKIWNVTLPGIAPTIITLFILNTGKVLDIGFEKVFLLYNPAIYRTADVISTYVYRIGLQNRNFSYATAINMSQSIVSLILVTSTNYLSKRLSETSLW
ncbi:MAG TPA: sugar ABC transporter permease [Clostridiaceae bacterium]|nr:sugar ABC transporter permease [Clostridiaceae bacterium]